MSSIRLYTLLGILAPSLVGFSPAGSVAAEKQLRVYNWAGFIGSKTIPEFERRFQTHILYENYSSNEELHARLKAEGDGYDVIFPSTYMVQILIREGMLQPLDRTQLPNLRHISTKFLNLPIDPGNRYSVPYLWGTTGLGVNRDKVQEPGNNLGILFKREYRGRISMLDGMRFALGIALKHLGFSANTRDLAELEKAGQLLLRQKPLVKLYSSDAYVESLAKGEVWISYGYSGDIYQLAQRNRAIQYFIPQQGSLIGLDSMCVPKNAPNPTLAHAFIDYLLEPKVAAEITNELWYASPNQTASTYIEKKILSDPALYPPEEVLARCEFLRDMGEATALYEKVWKEIRETKAR